MEALDTEEEWGEGRLRGNLAASRPIACCSCIWRLQLSQGGVFLMKLLLLGCREQLQHGKGLITATRCREEGLGGERHRGFGFLEQRNVLEPPEGLCIGFWHLKEGRGGRKRNCERES